MSAGRRGGGGWRAWTGRGAPSGHAILTSANVHSTPLPQARIEITLRSKKSDKPYVVERLIKGPNSTDTGPVSVWRINGEGVKRDAVRSLMSQLHIQMDNPTQFLPQEKVRAGSMGTGVLGVSRVCRGSSEMRSHALTLPHPPSPFPRWAASPS